MRNRLRLPAAVLLMLVLQRALLRGIEVEGVRPDGLLLLALMAGVIGGAEAGAVTGFAAGLATDLFLQTPLGLSALVFSVAGYAAGVLQAGMLRSSWWLPPVAALLGSAAGTVAFAVAGAVVGEAHLVSPRLGVVVPIVAVMNAVLSPIAVRVARWAILASPVRRVAT